MPDKLRQLLRFNFGSWYSHSIYKALVLVVFIGLAVPATIGSYFLIGVKEERAARLVLDESLQRYADIHLRGKQISYALVLAAQLLVSLFLIILFLHSRLVKPLRHLMGFSDILSHGNFETELTMVQDDELGRLGKQLEQMRLAIRQLFADVGQREERFRSIVTQVPGAVFRFRPDGPIEFVSDAIEEICGYPASVLMAGSTRTWANIISPLDRKVQRQHVVDKLRLMQAYEIEILDNVMFGIMFVRHRQIVSANQFCEQMFGYGPDCLHGKSTAIIFPTLEEFEQTLARQAASANGAFSQERQFKRADGSLFWCQLNGCTLDLEHPEEGCIWVYADVTERKLSEEKLRLGATVFDYIADGVVMTDAAGFIVAVNPAFTQITGYSESEAIGKTPAILRSGRQDQAFFDSLWAELLATGFWRGEIWNRRKNEELYLEWLTISAVRNSDGVCTHYVGVFSDITLVKESQEKLDHLAHHDPLTGLPNRLLFNDRLSHAIQRASREPRPLALLFIDLDRFKNVNDTLGHHIGDELLRQVAQALASKVRDGDTLARLGGDEFILLLEDSDGKYGAGVVADKLMSIFEQPFVVVAHELFVTASIGISIYPNDGDDLNMLIRNADVALYQAKAHGRNVYRFYSSEMTGESIERLRLENMLRRSVEKSEIFLNYQPQVDIETGLMVGVEALVRWHHPELGLVPPIKFIPIAEDTGFINQLGKWVLFEACRQMVRWDEAGMRVPKMAVNLSVDFGTGYSSLAYLKQMPVQTLKIDRSFIKDIGTDPDEEAIAIAIIQLGKSMHLSVVAEGVETQEQLQFLRREGCHFAQGYFYSKPVLAQDLLEKWR
ncbi:MAG: diguanylate cyclase [Burkholderiales bacterium]|nr:diguanylate cyclase [Burkholderiales bacterium]